MDLCRVYCVYDSPPWLVVQTQIPTYVPASKSRWTTTEVSVYPASGIMISSDKIATCTMQYKFRYASTEISSYAGSHLPIFHVFSKGAQWRIQGGGG